MSALAGFWLLLLAAQSSAHTAGQSYVYLWVEATETRGLVELPIDELKDALGPRHPIFTETRRGLSTAAVRRYVLEHLEFRVDGTGVALAIDEVDVENVEIGEYLRVSFTLDPPPQAPKQLTVRYTAILHALEDHRGGLVVEDNYLTGVRGNHALLSHWFAPSRNTFELKLAGRSLIERVWTFVVLGVEHIWIGIDHVLFIVTLLLTAVLSRRDGAWEPASDLRGALFNLFAIVTLFTVAHSITLALALKGWVQMPSRFVESVIALTVLAVAIDNLRPIFGRFKWTLVFLFGLFHGLGFASVLEDLTLQVESKAIALIGFNIGVEIGQLVIVAVLFPLLFVLRRYRYVGTVLTPGSLLVAAIALWWFIDRAFALNLLIPGLG
ncbi:MAG: HupE/UreJ family protein [Pseudomonadota bacterium]